MGEDDLAVFSNLSSASVVENVASTGITPLATDVDGDDLVTSYRIASSGNGALFELDAISGELLFNSSPNFETPLGSGGGTNTNSYVLTIEALDSDGSTVLGSQTLTITVEDANDSPTISPITSEVSANSGNFTVDLFSSSNDEDGDSLSINGTPTYTISVAGATAISISSSDASTYGLSFSVETLTVINTDHNVYSNLASGGNSSYYSKL